MEEEPVDDAAWWDAVVKFADEAEAKDVSERPLCKVISGGQTGADRAGLDAAFGVGLETGGFCPEGFVTSAGHEPDLGRIFGLQEIPADASGRISVAQSYAVRSRRNVDAADGTVVFRLAPSVGSDKTIGYSMTGSWSSERSGGTPRSPCLVVESIEDPDSASEEIVKFIRSNQLRTLNVAGHRASSSPVPNFSSRVTGILRVAFTSVASRNERKRTRAS